MLRRVLVVKFKITDQEYIFILFFQNYKTNIKSLTRPNTYSVVVGRIYGIDIHEPSQSRLHNDCVQCFY